MQRLPSISAIRRVRARSPPKTTDADTGAHRNWFCAYCASSARESLRAIRQRQTPRLHGRHRRSRSGEYTPVRRFFAGFNAASVANISIPCAAPCRILIVVVITRTTVPKSPAPLLSSSRDLARRPNARRTALFARASHESIRASSQQELITLKSGSLNPIPPGYASYKYRLGSKNSFISTGSLVAA